MKKAWLLLLCFCLAACGEDRRPLIRPSTDITDSVDREFAKIDTLNGNLSGPSPAQILKQCLAHYKDVTKIDTVLPTDSGVLHIQLKHCCAKDGGIYLPKSYLHKFGLDVFVTHNFITQVDLSINDKPTYTGIIGKDDFLPLLTGDLKNYGSLLYMDTRVERSRSGKGFVISYSLNIPMTAVSQAVTISVERNGSRRAFLGYGTPVEKAYPDSEVKL